MKILIVDGSNIASRAYWAGNPFSFFSMVRSAIRASRATRLIYVFDDDRKGWRHSLYPNYKADREEKPEELVLYLSKLKEYLLKTGVKIVQGPEGDDIIAGLIQSSFQSKRFEGEKLEFAIFSNDTDLWALIGPHTSVIKPPDMMPAAPYAELGIRPWQMGQYKALVGGHDNIPGCPGVGKVSARILLQEFMSITNIYEHLDFVSNLPLRKANSIRKSLEENRDQIMLSLTLSELTPATFLDSALDDNHWNMLDVTDEQEIIYNLRKNIMETDDFPLLRKSILESIAEEENMIIDEVIEEMS